MSVIGEDVHAAFVSETSSVSSNESSSSEEIFEELFEETRDRIAPENSARIEIEKFFGTSYDTVGQHRSEEDDAISPDISVIDFDETPEFREPDVRPAVEPIPVDEKYLEDLLRQVIESSKCEETELKSIEFLLTYAASVSHEDQTKLLQILVECKQFTRQIVHGVIKSFFVTLLIGMPTVQNGGDTYDQVLRAIREIYIDIVNEAMIIQGITSIDFVAELHKLLIEVRRMPLQNCIMEILTIISANYHMAARALIQQGIDRTLSTLDERFKLRSESGKIPLITLIWALLPNTPKIHCYAMSENLYDFTFRDNHVSTTAIWRREIQKDVWVPFIPPINYLIERSYREKREEFFCSQFGSILTIDFVRMVVIDESTSIRKAISRVECESYIPIKVKKTKMDHAHPYTTSNFVAFSYKILTRRFPMALCCHEKFICLYALAHLFEHLNRRHQHVLLYSFREVRYLWKPYQTVETMKNLLNGKVLYERMFAMQILTALIRKEWVMYDDILNHYGTFRLMTNVSMETKQGRDDMSTVPFDSWMKRQAFECRMLIRTKEEYPPFFGDSLSTNASLDIESTRRELEYHMNSFFNEFRANIVTRRFDAIKYFLDYLTGPRSDDKKLSRMRMFLEVFAKIPSRLPTQDFEIYRFSYAKLVRELSYFVIDFQERTNKNFTTIYRTGINAIGSLSSKRLEIVAHNSFRNRDNLLRVRPFTTIQFLEHFVFSEKSPASYDRWSASCNVRFYANLKIKFETTLDGNKIPSDWTVYEAICRFGLNGDEKDVFDKQYKFIFSRVPVDLSPAEDDSSSNFDSRTHVLKHYLRKRDQVHDNSGLTESVRNALHLTDILYGINKHWTSAYPWIKHTEDLIPPIEFVNHSLDAIVTSRLMDPFAALVGKMPPWIKHITDNCPFILSLKTRKFAFQVLYLDRLRALKVVLEKNFKFGLYVNILENDLKMIVRRGHILEDVRKFFCHTNPGAAWDVKFYGEIGSGEGLRSELFTSAGRELQKADLKIWAPTESAEEEDYVHCGSGLYPRFEPKVHREMKHEDLSRTFFIVGALLGKALIEGELIDLPLSPLCFKWLLDQECLSTVDDLKYVNPWIQKILGEMQKLVLAFDRISSNIRYGDRQKAEEIDKLRINGDTVESFELDFVLPGYENIELCPGGRDKSVKLANAQSYINKVKRALLFSGVQVQFHALKNGFDHVVKLDKIRIFEPEELLKMVCGEEDDEYWSLDNLNEYVDLEDYSPDCTDIENLFSLLSTASKQTRRQFLEFVTGCSRLPADGFKGLNPALTITRVSDGYPSAQTCFNQLKLPAGMSRSELVKFIEDVVPEGLNYFGFV